MNSSFWPVEFILFHFFKYPSIGNSFSISWKYILNESFTTESGNGFSFQCEQCFFIYMLFLKPLLQLEGGQYFKKVLFLLVETICFNFFRHWFEWKQFPGLVKPYFSTNLSFWLMEMNFRVNSKPCAFIRRFFLLENAILESRCKPISWDVSSS